MAVERKYEDAGTGALFKNDRKEKPSHPDYRGDVTINGQKYWLSAWLKTSEKTGKKFMSLALREADQQQQSKSSGHQLPVDEEIPFAPEVR